MIPEIVEFRDSLPATSSGKVDRKKLSDLDIKSFSLQQQNH
jgi:acyl-CoA synthetase (AMP-forming)/AMP-acid ligase II